MHQKITVDGDNSKSIVTSAILYFLFNFLINPPTKRLHSVYGVVCETNERRIVKINLSSVTKTAVFSSNIPEHASVYHVGIKVSVVYC